MNEIGYAEGGELSILTVNRRVVLAHLTIATHLNQVTGRDGVLDEHRFWEAHRALIMALSALTAGELLRFIEQLIAYKDLSTDDFVDRARALEKLIENGRRPESEV